MAPPPPYVQEMQEAACQPGSAAHSERHSGHGNIVRNFIIGFADGLTVPFALTAGLSSLGRSDLVIVAGLAELVSGSISMGLGAYLAATTERNQYIAEERRERREIVDDPATEREEVYSVFSMYGLDRELVRPVVEKLVENEDMWIKFMMDCELKMQCPDASGNWIDALVMGISYLVGGIIPMTPYFGLKNVHHALFTSIGITVVILLVFGYFKAWFTSNSRLECVWSAAQTLLVGATASAASYGIVKGVNSAFPTSVCG